MFVRIIKPSQMWGGDDGDVGTDPTSVVDNIFSRDAETQSAEDQDWNSDSDTGDQAKSKSSENEESEATDDQEDGADDSEEQDEEESGEDEDESTEESDDEFQLPEKQAKSYDDKVLTHYAKRIGTTLAALKGNPPLMKAVKSMIDNDIYTRDLKAQAEEDESQEDVTDDAKDEAADAKETTEVKQLTPEQQEQQFNELRTQLKAFVKDPTMNDPRMIAAYKAEQAKAWGIDISQPGAEAKLKAKGIDLDAMVESQISFMANALNTYLPRFLPHLMSTSMEASFPGFGKMYENALQSNVWEEVQASKPELSGAPAFGTPEFNKKITEVLKANPWIDRAKFTDAKGRPMGKVDTIREKFKIAAGFMVGIKPDPKVVEKAVEAGRQEARKVDVKKKAASNLGAGKQSGTLKDGKPKLKGSGGGFVEEYEQRKGGF